MGTVLPVFAGRLRLVRPIHYIVLEAEALSTNGSSEFAKRSPRHPRPAPSLLQSDKVLSEMGLLRANTLFKCYGKINKYECECMHRYLCYTYTQIYTYIYVCICMYGHKTDCLKLRSILCGVLLCFCMIYVQVFQGCLKQELDIN